MDGILGTEAPLLSDLALIVSVLLWVAASVGAVNAHRRRYAQHCPVMATAALVNWLPVLAVMVPRAVGAATGAVEVPAGPTTALVLVHAILGVVTQPIMTYTVTRMYWMEKLPPEEPVWLMKATMTLWSAAVISGSAVYVSWYV